MTITGITYDNQGPTATSDAVFHENIFTDGVLRGCEVSFVGAQITIAPGYLISAGRLCAFQSAETVSVPAQLGVARVVLQTNLGEESSSSVFRQLSLVVQTASTVGGLPALVQEDINGGGVIYQHPLCTLSVNSTGIQSVIEEPKGAQLNMRAVKIGAATFNGLADITLSEMGSAELDAYGKVAAGQSSSRIVEISSTARTLSATDAGCMLMTRNPSNTSQSYTITIPPNADVSIPIGTEIEILRYYGGSVTITADADVDLFAIGCVPDKNGQSISINSRYGVCVLKKVFTDYWVASGDVSVV